MPLSRNRFGPCSERNRSMNMWNVPAGIGSSCGQGESADAVVVPVAVEAIVACAWS